MKTLKVLATIVAKVLVAIFAAIGMLMFIVTIISTKVFVGHVNDVLDEDGGIEKDGIEIASEASARSFADANLMENPIILVASKVIAPIVHLFWKF